VRERQQQTLDMLLQIPEDRRTILRAKYVGSLFKGWPWLVLLGLNVVIGTAVGAYHPVSSIALLLAPWPPVLLLAGVGLLVSVRAGTPLQANMIMAVMMLAYSASLFCFAPIHQLVPSSFFFSWWGDMPSWLAEPITLARVAAVYLAITAAAYLVREGAGAAFARET
jgi:ABC-type transport system involved in multi-copper enzyme maturation permease subunit